jgi:hypothetical protein
MRRGCLWFLSGCALVLMVGLFGGTLMTTLQKMARHTTGSPSVTPSQSSVLGHPSLSAAFVDRVLLRAASPAAGLGQAFYEESLTTGIDDAFPLAIFKHESSLGKQGIATVTHSVGNIRCAGYPTCYQGFRFYQTWHEGLHDLYHLLATEYIPYGLVTPAQILHKYAPAGDGNDPAGYAAAVVSYIQAWHAGQLAERGGAVA